MDTDMPFYTDGQTVRVADAVDAGFQPPTYEIARAVEHYRKRRNWPIPALLEIRFLYYDADAGVDLDGQQVFIPGTLVELYDGQETKLASYTFRGSRLASWTDAAVP